jgi:hypothetical protein
MKNRIPLFCTTILLLASTACKTHVPMVQHESANYQRKAEAVEHWNRMVSEIADGLAARPDMLGKSIYLVPLPAQATQFEAAYWKLLKVRLVNSSWKVVENPQAAEFVFSFESQLVSHGNRGFYWGNATTLWSTIGFDVTHFFTGDYTGDDWETRQDLLVTTFVRKGGNPVTAASQIVYVPTGDSHLYLEPSRAISPDFFADWAPTVARAMNR